jgi:hypothetical protein
VDYLTWHVKVQSKMIVKTNLHEYEVDPSLFPPYPNLSLGKKWEGGS